MNKSNSSVVEKNQLFQNRSSLREQAKMFNHHDYDWWNQDSNRKKLLKKVFKEDSDSDEDDRGDPIYKK